MKKSLLRIGATVLATWLGVSIANAQEAKPAGGDVTELANELPAAATSEQDKKLPTLESNFQNMQWDLMMVGTAMTNGMGEGFSWTDNEPGVEFIGMLNYGPFYALGYFTNVCCVQAYAFPVYTETDFAVGIRPAVGKFVFDLSAWWYVLGEYRDTSSDFWMVIASASYDVTDRLKVTGLVQWTADYANLGFDTHSPYLKAAYTFDKASKWTVSGGFGWYDFAEELPGNANYEFWDVGLAYQLSDMVSAEVRYHDSSRESGTPECLGGLDACGPAVAFRLTVATSMRQLLGSNGSDH